MSFCWGCGGIGIYTVLGIRKARPDELKKIMAYPEIKAAMAAKAMGGDPVDVVNAMTRSKKK